jgi:cullin 3
MMMDKQDATKTFNILASAIDEIYNRNASQLSFEELYRYAYNLVLQKYGNILYDGITSKLTYHLQNTVQILQQTHASQLLDAIVYAWREHTVTMVMIRDILMYMDRTYVVQHKRRTVYELGLHLFRITVWEHPSVSKRVCTLLLDAIANERAGITGTGTGTTSTDSTTMTTTSGSSHPTNSTYNEERNLIKQCIIMLIELGRADYSVAVYQQDFELLFLCTTQEFYANESLQYLSQATASDYVRKATQRIEQEKERAAILQLPISTEGPLMNIVQTEWIERHARTLVDMETTGFSALLQDDTKLYEMQQMYDLFVRVPSSLEYLRDALAEQIKANGRQLILDQISGTADPSSFVRGVLQLRNKYEKIVEISFRNEKKVMKRMREAFEDFLNADARAASCLAVYVDELLRVGLRGYNDEQINVELQKVITIFRYLSDKDVFESFYKQYLAKRLLGNRSVSDDAERAMVSLLKAECGYQFTTKLEGMFNDMRISRETRDRYKQHQRQQQEMNDTIDNNYDNSSHNIDIEVDVLTTGYWPSQSVPPCTVPLVIQDAMDRFAKFYLEKHTGRKLSWQTSAGAAELRATFGTGPDNYRRHELCVSTYQMCILLLFNTTDTLTLGQIRSHVHVPDQELRRHLISLCTPKNRILKKASKGRGISSDDDKFTFNVEYTSKLKRVRIPLVKEISLTNDGSNAPGMSNDESGGAGSSSLFHSTGTTGNGTNTSGTSMMMMDGSVPVAVEEDRRHLVEAAIVRIMKARKSMNHNDLIAEVTKQLSIRFTPLPQFIKKRIESLIEREYLERSVQEHRVYRYIA